MTSLLRTFLIIILISMTACSSNETVPELSEQRDPSSQLTQEQNNLIFNENTALELMREYRLALVSLFEEAGENQQVLSYQTKKEVKQHFQNVMSDNLASWMANSYFKEEQDALYVIAKDSPTWLVAEKPYTVEQVTETHYKISQERDNELLGHVMMIYHAVYDGDKWVVDAIEANEVGILTSEQAELYLKENLNLEPYYSVEFDQMIDEQYLIHVYELVDKGKTTEHTATKGWYLVHPTTKKISNYMTSDSSTDDRSPSIEEVAHTVLQLIATKDFETLSSYIHPEKGVLFSPYVYVEPEAVVFQKTAVRTFFENNQQYTWGAYDGSGEPIELKPSEYYSQFLYKSDFRDSDEVNIDKLKSRGNTINNIKDYFPDSHVVEFYSEGSSEYAGMDWESINLVFEKDQSGMWKTVAIVNDRWTI